MYVCMYYIHVYMHAFIYIYIYIYQVQVYIYIYTHTYIYMLEHNMVCMTLHAARVYTPGITMDRMGTRTFAYV